MPKMLRKMKLSPEEERFLRRWIYDEAHFQEGAGPARPMQVAHAVVAADVDTPIAAAMPDLAEQEAAAGGPAPPGAVSLALVAGNLVCAPGRRPCAGRASARSRDHRGQVVRDSRCGHAVNVRWPLFRARKCMPVWL